MSFPKDYFKKGYFPISSISSAGDGSQLAFSLPCDHHIYFTKDGNNLDRKIAKSKYIDEFVPKGGNPYEYFAENPFYGSLYFDPYRNLFFRIVKHPYKKAAELGINHCYDYPPAFSIQILDNEFNLLGEQKINGLKYSMYVLFIHPDGIYISSSNPKNDNTKEDKLDFQLFEIHDVFDKS
ncbi:MAG TPA: DUF4221 domain-containing protein [Saprospiraceae bacterium]|nr:DUF4221 domain-containing protein [Saprospiraceae bacterium]